MLPLIIRLIYAALRSNDIRVLLVGLLKAYRKNKALKATLDAENVGEHEIDQPYSTFNPSIIKKFLSILKPNELSQLKSQLDKLDNASAIKNIINANVDNDNQKDKLDNKGWVELSSSWFKKGAFYLTNKNLQLGLLQALFQSDTSKNKRWYGVYTYPNMPLETWELMKKQKGKNGSGAGTIFWKYFLKDFLPSQIRRYVKQKLKTEQGITKAKQRYNVIKANNINVLKTTTFINRLERGFFKLKQYRNLPKTELSSFAYRQERRQTILQMKTYATYKKLK